MCEYCGCQALTAIDELTREHDLVVNLIGDVRAAYATGDAARMTRLSRRITAVLGPHTEVEEHGLFPAMAADFPDQVAALAAEHRRIEAVLGEAAAGTPTDPTWPARLVEILDLLREHILKEQDGVFPAALTTLRPADWDAVDAVRARVRSRQRAWGATSDARRAPDRAAAAEDRLKVT
jgi:hemerythrin-like domain-containing protein